MAKISLVSNLASVQSNVNQQLCLNVKNENVPYNTLDSLPKPFGMQKIKIVDNKVDFITELSSEISHKILRMLDTESLNCAAWVSRKWKMMCEYELELRKVQYYSNVKIEGTDAYYEQLWERLMQNIEITYGKRFPF